MSLQDEGWVEWRPALSGEPPPNYTDVSEWEVQFWSYKKTWIATFYPRWSKTITYRLRPRATPAPSGLPAWATPAPSGLPDNNPKTRQGTLKTPLLSVLPASALIQMGEVMRLGKEKYGAFNWRDYPVTYSTYVDAAMRHLMQFWDGETVDPESGVSHLAHAAAGLTILMDAIATGNASDDRPKEGAAADLISIFKKRREGDG